MNTDQFQAGDTIIINKKGSPPKTLFIVSAGIDFLTIEQEGKPYTAERNTLHADFKKYQQQGNDLYLSRPRLAS